MNVHLHSREVGRMTSAMRAAAAPNVPRALRVAIVRGGRIVEERLFRERERVALGGLPHERDGVVFDVARGAWILCAPSGATGHVVSRDGKIEIGPSATRVPLDDASRGKIVLGHASGATIVLFQLVVPPPRPSRAQLPIATRRAEIDWALTIIAAFSFLIHFGVVGSMFSDWLDPVVEDSGAAIGLVEMTMTTRAAPTVEDRDEPSAHESAPSAHESASASTPSSHHELARASRESAAELAREAQSMELGLLTVMNAPLAVDGALRRGDVPIQDLERVAREAGGARPTSGELRLATGDGATVPGAHTLTEIGGTRVEVARSGDTRPVVGPRVDVEPILDPLVHILGLEAVVARLRPSFRSCYTRGLTTDPTMEGKMTIDIAVAPNGDVTNVTKLDGEGLSPAVEQCIIMKAHNAAFPAPGATVHARIPIIFRQQH